MFWNTESRGEDFVSDPAAGHTHTHIQFDVFHLQLSSNMQLPACDSAKSARIHLNVWNTAARSGVSESLRLAAKTTHNGVYHRRKVDSRIAAIIFRV